MSQRERVENEIFGLRRKADAILAAAGDMQEYSRIQITISKLQEIHGVTTGVRREMEMQNQIETEQQTEGIGQSIPDFTRKAMAALQQKREGDYAEACVAFDEELKALAVESSDLEGMIQDTAKRLASMERVARFRADELIVAGKATEAQETLAELEESKGELAKSEERRREIAARRGQLETAKKTALRNGAETFRESCIALIRRSEASLAGVLDMTRDTLNVLEMQTGAPLYRPEDLTAHEKSNEWVTLSRLYSVRTR